MVSYELRVADVTIECSGSPSPLAQTLAQSGIARAGGVPSVPILRGTESFGSEGPRAAILGLGRSSCIDHGVLEEGVSSALAGGH
jgi:hypothetical protein